MMRKEIPPKAIALCILGIIFLIWGLFNVAIEEIAFSVFAIIFSLFLFLATKIVYDTHNSEKKLKNKLRDARIEMEDALEKKGFYLTKEVEYLGLLLFIDDRNKKWAMGNNINFIYSFSDLINYELIINETANTCKLMELHIQVNNEAIPLWKMTFLNVSHDKSSSIYIQAHESANKFIEMLNIIKPLSQMSQEKEKKCISETLQTEENAQLITSDQSSSHATHLPHINGYRESYSYPDVFISTYGKKLEEGQDVLFQTDPDNIKSKFAVAVIVNGETVGHLPNNRLQDMFHDFQRRDGIVCGHVEKVLYGGWVYLHIGYYECHLPSDVSNAYILPDKKASFNEIPFGKIGWYLAMQKPYVVIDVETTGLNSKVDRIIEICAIKFVGRIELDRYISLINPIMSIPAAASKVNKITDDMLENSPSFSDVADELLVFINGCVLAAHNARFDISFLREEYKRCGHDFQCLYTDTLYIARNLFSLDNYKLQTVLDEIKFVRTTHHRSESDCEGCAEIIKHALVEYEESGKLKVMLVDNHTKKIQAFIGQIKDKNICDGIISFDSNKDSYIVHCDDNIIGRFPKRLNNELIDVQRNININIANEGDKYVVYADLCNIPMSNVVDDHINC